MDLNKEITITEKQFMKASAEAMANDRMNELLHTSPVLILFAAVYSDEIAKILFKKENAESEVTE